jgi:hypothetical protein
MMRARNTDRHVRLRALTRPPFTKSGVQSASRQERRVAADVAAWCLSSAANPLDKVSTVCRMSVRCRVTTWSKSYRQGVPNHV